MQKQTKVKIFRGDDIESTERTINNFIKDKFVIDIKFNSELFTTEYTNGVPSHSTCFDSVLIIYEE